MSLHMITAATDAGKAGLNPYVVGGIVLGILLALILGLLAFGAGREHS